MEPYQLRVIAEKKELDSKRDSLSAFTHTDAFQSLPQAERHLLIEQSRAMEVYSVILWRRIQNWPGQE